MQGFSSIPKMTTTMKTVIAHIECNKEGFYSVYVPEDLPFGLLGEGNTAEEAKQDFLAVYEAMREAHRVRTGDAIELQFDFVMDASAFLQQYKGIFTLAGLSRLTGINKAQLSQYVCGTRRPSPRTQAKIKESIQELANELSRVFI